MITGCSHYTGTHIIVSGGSSFTTWPIACPWCNQTQTTYVAWNRQQYVTMLDNRVLLERERDLRIKHQKSWFKVFASKIEDEHRITDAQLRFINARQQSFNQKKRTKTKLQSKRRKK